MSNPEGLNPGEYLVKFKFSYGRFMRGDTTSLDLESARFIVDLGAAEYVGDDELPEHKESLAEIDIAKLAKDIRSRVFSESDEHAEEIQVPESALVEMGESRWWRPLGKLMR